MSEHYPGLFKRGKIWWFKTPGPDGKRIQRSTGKTAEREAIKVAKEIESKIAQNAKSAEGLPVAYQAILERASHEAQQGRLTLQRTETLVRDIHALANPDYNRVSLDQHLANWIEDQSLHVSARTVEIYGDMRRLMTEALGKRASSAPVDKLTTSQVKAAIRKIKVGKVQPSRQGGPGWPGRRHHESNIEGLPEGDGGRGSRQPCLCQPSSPGEGLPRRPTARWWLRSPRRSLARSSATSGATTNTMNGKVRS